jgi:hypothetical protein
MHRNCLVILSNSTPTSSLQSAYRDDKLRGADRVKRQLLISHCFHQPKNAGRAKG